MDSHLVYRTTARSHSWLSPSLLMETPPQSPNPSPEASAPHRLCVAPRIKSRVLGMDSTMASPKPCRLLSPGSPRNHSATTLSTQGLSGGHALSFPLPANTRTRSFLNGKALLPCLPLENKPCSFGTVLKQALEEKVPDTGPLGDPNAPCLSYQLWRARTSTFQACVSSPDRNAREIVGAQCQDK